MGLARETWRRAGRSWRDSGGDALASWRFAPERRPIPERVLGRHYGRSLRRRARDTTGSKKNSPYQAVSERTTSGTALALRLTDAHPGGFGLLPVCSVALQRVRSARCA